MKGSGIPVTGMIPIVMPMFTNTWNKKTTAIPPAMMLPYMSRDRVAIRRARQMSST